MNATQNGFLNSPAKACDSASTPNFSTSVLAIAATPLFSSSSDCPFLVNVVETTAWCCGVHCPSQVTSPDLIVAKEPSTMPKSSSAKQGLALPVPSGGSQGIFTSINLLRVGPVVTVSCDPGHAVVALGAAFGGFLNKHEVPEFRVSS